MQYMRTFLIGEYVLLGRISYGIILLQEDMSYRKTCLNGIIYLSWEDMSYEIISHTGAKVLHEFMSYRRTCLWKEMFLGRNVLQEDQSCRRICGMGGGGGGGGGGVLRKMSYWIML